MMVFFQGSSASSIKEAFFRPKSSSQFWALTCLFWDKVIKKIVAEQLQDFPEDSSASYFRPGFGMVMALISLVDGLCLQDGKGYASWVFVIVSTDAKLCLRW